VRQAGKDLESDVHSQYRLGGWELETVSLSHLCYHCI